MGFSDGRMLRLPPYIAGMLLCLGFLRFVSRSNWGATLFAGSRYCPPIAWSQGELRRPPHFSELARHEAAAQILKKVRENVRAASAGKTAPKPKTEWGARLSFATPLVVAGMLLQTERGSMHAFYQFVPRVFFRHAHLLLESRIACVEMCFVWSESRDPGKSHRAKEFEDLQDPDISPIC